MRLPLFRKITSFQKDYFFGIKIISLSLPKVPSCHQHYLSGETLVGVVCEEVPDDGVVVLLSSHVHGREPILALQVHTRVVLDQDPYDVLLASCGVE